MVQAVVSGILLFILYRFLLSSIGADGLGVWSVVLATTTASKLAELGLSGSVIKYVAQYRERGDNQHAARVIQTAGTALLLFVGLGVCVLGPLAYWGLALVIDAPEDVQLARSLLPYAMVSLWISALSGVFQSALDGCSRIDVRSYLVTVGSVLYLVLALLIVPTYGLIGLAIAQVVHVSSLTIFSYLLVRREFTDVSLRPIGWDRDVFREILSYGLKYQLITVATMLFEPITKGLLSKFGSLPSVAYYEMASRLTAQVRLLLVSAQKVLVPLMASLKERGSSELSGYYSRSVEITIFLALPVYGVLVGLSSLIGDIWIGHAVPEFSIYVGLLAVGWFCNTLAGPAYFSNLGTGELRWNSIVQVTMGGANLIFGGVLGYTYGPIGIVFAWSLCLCLGAAFLVWSFHREHQISFKALFSHQHIPLLIISIGCGLLGYVTTGFAHEHLWGERAWVNYAIISVVVCPQIVAAWFHPKRKELWSSLRGNSG